MRVSKEGTRHGVEANVKEQGERLQEMREQFRGKDDPNPPRHRIAATLRFCSI